MPRLDRGIQYTAADVVKARSPTRPLEYWIARFRGRWHRQRQSQSRSVGKGATAPCQRSVSLSQKSWARLRFAHP